MKYTILGILFVAILLFGCIQEEVETPDVLDDDEVVVPDDGDTAIEDEIETDESTETETEEEEEEETSEETGFLSQVCTYSDAESESTYYLTESKMKMVTVAQGMTLEFIIDLEESIMYDKGGMMLMGGMPGCTWIKYDFNKVQEVMEREGLVSEDESMIGDMSEIDDSFVCKNQIISDDVFVMAGEICDGTENFIDFLLMMQQYQ